VECDALNTLGAVLSILGAPEDGIQVLRRGKRLAEELGALQELRRAYINLGQSLDHAGRLDEAAAVTREGWERLRPRIGGTAAAFLAAEAGGRLRRLGRWEEALAILGEARETARPDWTTGLVLAELAVLEALRGEFERAGASLDALVELRPKGIPHWPSAEANAAAALAWARGDPPEVRQVVDLDSPIWQSDPAFHIPRFAYALSADADVALQARAAGDEAAEHDAVTRARALLDRVHVLTASDSRPLGHPPRDLLLEVELCELEAGRARGETNPDAWGALASRWQELGGHSTPLTRSCRRPTAPSPRICRARGSPRPLPVPEPQPCDSVIGRFSTRSRPSLAAHVSAPRPRERRCPRRSLV
jgi:tetratricopeptide (TPR) repeat protein